MEKLPEFIANHLILVTLFVAILSMLLWNLLGTAMMGVKHISTAELTQMVNKNKALLLDIRSQDAYNNGHIIDSLHIPTAEFESRIKQLPGKADRPVVIYCAHGTDSAKACRLLRMQGREQVYMLRGGLHSWQSANLPIVKT